MKTWAWILGLGGVVTMAAGYLASTRAQAAPGATCTRWATRWRLMREGLHAGLILQRFASTLHDDDLVWFERSSDTYYSIAAYRPREAPFAPQYIDSTSTSDTAADVANAAAAYNQARQRFQQQITVSC